MQTEEFQTPGELIQDLLKARRWSQRTLAVILETGEGTLTRLVAGQQPVRAEFAVVLEDVFGVPAECFLALQSKLDLAIAKKRTRPDPDRAARRRLHGELPIGEMIKRGWLDAHDIRETRKVEAALMRFFGVNRRDDIAVPPAVAGEGTKIATAAQLAWLRRVRQIARGVPVAPYSSQAVRAAIAELRASLGTLEGVARAPHLLAECGIRLAVVEALAATGIDGACLWLNDGAPVIGLSLRVDRIDHFWFVLRHELEHVLQRRGLAADLLDVSLEDADCAAARAFCVSPAALDDFIAQNVPYISECALTEFARVHQLHPGILAGLIQSRTGKYDGRYNRFRSHLAKVRAIVCAQARSDGWGEPAPAMGRSPRSIEPDSSHNFTFLN